MSDLNNKILLYFKNRSINPDEQEKDKKALIVA